MATTNTGAVSAFTHPMLRPDIPVLQRNERELQIGIDHPSALIFDVAPGLDVLVMLLDGCYHLSEIYRRCARAGLDHQAVDWRLSVLGEAGLIVEGGGRAPSRVRNPLATKRVRLVGAGALGKAIGDLLVRSGIETLYVIDSAPTDTAIYPTAGVLGSRAEALRAWLVGQTSGVDRAATRVVVANHWAKPEASATDLTVIAADRMEIDRVVADGLVQADQPHLIVRSQAGGVVVGPLVIPGHTPCVRCMDLTRRDADPAWPRLLRQLCRLGQPATPAMASWAAGVGAAQALGFLSGGTPESRGATLELSAPDFVTRWRSWPVHVGCGCHWGVTAQWGHE